MENSKVVGGDEDVVITMKGAPGVAYTVFAHSATFPDGSKVGRMTLSQVHGDKVPMAPPNGTSPALVGTLQPARVKFNPPVRIQVPNSSALPAGQVVEVYSFDHDLEQFVSGGTARVSDDGSVIVSDPGFGLRVSGWHAAPPPPPPPTCADGCNTNDPCRSGTCGSDGQCHFTNQPDGTACTDDGDACTFDQCKSGSCTHPRGTLTLTVKAQNGFNISTAPAMPDSIVGQAKITGVDPDPTPNTTVRWENKIHFNAGGVRNIDDTLAPVDQPGSQDYKPNFPHIRGGQMTITATIIRNGQKCDSKQDQQQIKGLNPGAGTIQGALPSQFEIQIACQESHFRQFSSSPGNPLMRCEPDGRIGVGVLQQTTPTASDDAFWNWQQAIAEGLGTLASKRAAAAGYPGRVRRSTRGCPNNTLCNAGATDFTADQLLRESLQRYNGGAYWHWDHVNNVWVAQPPNNYVALVLACH